MKIWLDDERMPPSDDWLWVTTAKDAIQTMDFGNVTVISLDHDLGDLNPHNTGGAVLRWLEQQHSERGRKSPLILIHTRNVVARMWMTKVAQKLNQADAP